MTWPRSPFFSAIHPDAPAGGAGPGFSKSPAPVGFDVPLTSFYPRSRDSCPPPEGVAGASAVVINVDKRLLRRRSFTVSRSRRRKVYTPREGNGRTLYFFFGYTDKASDKLMRGAEAPFIEDDIKAAVRRGFKVIYDKSGTYQDFFDAINDPECYGVYWSGHGFPNGDIQSSDGKQIRPDDIDATRRSSVIRYLILATCNSGVAASKWQSAMGSQCRFEGWLDVTSPPETIDFTSSSGPFDSWFSHDGMNPDWELEDYINHAAQNP